MKETIPYIVFEITPRCNLSCLYCYNIWKIPGQHAPREADFSRVKKTLKRLFRIAAVKHITFSGGEPFVFPRLAEIVLFCRMKKKEVTIISNGYKGEYQDYETLIRMGVGLFEFPLHSYKEEVHDRIAGQSGAWKRAVQSIKHVLALKGQVVVVIVMTKMNDTDIPKSMEFIKNLGISRIMLNRFNIGGQGITEEHRIGLSNDRLRKAFAAAHKAVCDLGITVSSNVCTPFCVVNPKDYPRIGFSACYPRQLNRPWTLDPPGNIRFCNHSPHVAGNIFTHSFKEILESSYIKEWHNTIPGICAECALYKKCWGGCRAAAEQLGMGLDHADPIVYEQFRLSVGDD